QTLGGAGEGLGECILAAVEPGACHPPTDTDQLLRLASKTGWGAGIGAAGALARACGSPRLAGRRRSAALGRGHGGVGWEVTAGLGHVCCSRNLPLTNAS